MSKRSKKIYTKPVFPRLLYKFSVLFASIYSKCLWIHSFGVYETPPGEVLAYTKQCVLHNLTAWGSLGAVNGPGSCPSQAKIYTPDFRAIRLKQRFLQSRCHGGSSRSHRGQKPHTLYPMDMQTPWPLYPMTLWTHPLLKVHPDTWYMILNRSR